VFCNHEHFPRDERNDRLFFRAWWSDKSDQRVLVVDSATLHECLLAMESDPILCTHLDRAKDWWAAEQDRCAQLRAVIGPQRHVELAEQAERRAHPTAPWFVPRRREAASAAYAASVALVHAAKAA
jgi:hypothetical protein